MKELFVKKIREGKMKKPLIFVVPIIIAVLSVLFFKPS